MTAGDAEAATIRQRLERLDAKVRDDPDPRALVIVYLVQAVGQMLDCVDHLTVFATAEALKAIDTWVADAEATIA